MPTQPDSQTAEPCPSCGALPCDQVNKPPTAPKPKEQVPDRQCPYCGVSYSHSLDCKRSKIEVLMEDAMQCLMGNQPEDVSKAEAKRQIIDRIQKWLRYGEIE